MSERLPYNEYAHLKRRVLDRDGWKCRACGIRQNLHVHHIIFRSAGGLDTMENLISVCFSCHDAVHDKHPRFKLTFNGVGFVKTFKGILR